VPEKNNIELGEIKLSYLC